MFGSVLHPDLYSIILKNSGYEFLTWSKPSFERNFHYSLPSDLSSVGFLSHMGQFLSSKLQSVNFHYSLPSDLSSVGFLSNMGQFLSSKLQSVNLSPAVGSSTPTYSCPKPSKLSPLKEKVSRREFGGGGAISSNAPIVFDLGPLQGGGEPKDTTNAGQTFDAAFLGSMPVNVATSQ